MNKINIGVIYGGISTEHEVSIKSGKSIISNLDKDRYNIFKIYIDKKGDFYDADNGKIDNVFTYLKELDVIFPVLHGLYGEDGTIQGLLEILGISYVGCGVLSSSIGMDKIYSKIIFEKASLNVAEYIYLKKDKDKYIYVKDNFNEEEIDIDKINDLIIDSLSYPVFIKPSRSGSSIGINKANNKEELKKYIDYAFRFDNKILIERCIKGRELECAILNGKASSIGEILPSEEFYSYNAKYIGDSKTIIPDDIPKEHIDKIKKTAIKAFNAIDGEGLSRVDFFLEESTNKIYINEINTMPGFTEISMYPKLFYNDGISYRELLDILIEDAIDNKQC